MNRTSLIMIGSLVVLGGLVALLTGTGPATTSESGEPITLLCAASNRAVIESIRQEYEQEFGRAVVVQYGPSQTLLSTLEVGGIGDLYLPADDSFLDIAKSKSLVVEVLPIAKMQGVVAVKKGNPKQIETFQDLLREDVRFVQANPDAAAIAKLTRDILKQQGLWDQLDKSTVAYRTTVTDVANDLLVDASDAGIVYDAVLHTYPDLEFVELPELKAASSQVSVGVITSSTQPTAALHFARYVTAKDRGLKNYAAHSYRVEGGDQWADVPELNFFVGSMLRPAVDDTITAFEAREGVIVNRDYNGCGILVAQMKANQIPDAYFACDTEFMEQVPDLFPESVPVSQNELVIVVQKGNPHNIGSLQDLSKEGLRVGIGHEKQCAMGWLTQNTFREGGVQQEVMANVKVQTPTGDMLINQMKTQSLDAAVVYLSNTAGSFDVLDAVRIHGLDCSVATQPFAIKPDSPHARTASRLFEQICSAKSQDAFIAEGFQWAMNPAPADALTDDSSATGDGNQDQDKP